ncbi:hypothetical protein PoB_002970200 [Plakobranchus ocellatus]|uniref:C2H2-type domain-containing protein n=1 Tax=Plakobranchus ocellatus TaxID=259542 RepID=A0AAV4A8D5_9GAST|nr:hypothetical protein PoB_002970200 [Plakobranchus ocellatus]
MAEDFDIDLHPIRLESTSVSQFELDSLYDAYTKNCTQNRALKVDCENLQKNNEKLQSQLDQATAELRLRSLQIDEEKAQVSMRNLQLAFQTCLTQFWFQRALTIARASELQDGVTQTQNETVENTSQTCEARHQIDTSEAELKKKLEEVEAFYDMVLRENNSMKRKMAKLTSKLRIMSAEAIQDADIVDGVTVHKQGRFLIHKGLECEQCSQTFSSHAEMEASTCDYHPKQAVPQDGPEGKMYYFLCCSKLVKNKGQACGCSKGKHRLLSMKHRNED